MNGIALREMISPEFNLIETSETMGGALTHLASLLSKIQALPTVNSIITLAEAELAEEDREAFENLEKAVAWFHEKIKILLPHVTWKPNSHEMAAVNALLSFKTLSLKASGYVGSLLFELRRLFIEVAHKEKNHTAFEGWTRIEEDTNQRIFDWPDYVDESLNTLPVEKQIHQWKERADVSLSCLLRFLKILAQYSTFIPLTLPARPTPNNLPKNLHELEERQYQGYVGYYLSLFRSADLEKHPLSYSELIRLINRFLYMIEQKIDSNKKDIDKRMLGHWRTDKCNQDIASLIPFAKKIWIKHLSKCKHPMRLGCKKLADELLEELPSYISLLSKGEKRRPRAVKAIEATDPRMWDKGKYIGLKPHWKNFDWVKI